MIENTELMTLEDMAARYKGNPADMWLSTQAESGRIAQRNALGRIAEIMGVSDYRQVPYEKLTKELVLAVRDRLRERNKDNTVNRMMFALRDSAKDRLA